MRKLISCLILVVLLSTFSGSVYGKEANKDKNTSLNKCIKIGTEFLNEYYTCIETNEVVDVEKFVNNKRLQEYIEIKHSIMKGRLVYQDLSVDEYDIEIDTKSYSVIGDEIEVVFTVLVKHKYAGNDTASESKQPVRLKFISNSNNQLVIDDYYEYTEFDRDIIIKKNASNKSIDIEYSNELLLQENVNAKINFDDDTLIILRKQLVEEKNYYDKLRVSELEYVSSTDVSEALNVEDIQLMSSSWNRSAIVTYAENNCSKDNPSSGNSSLASYYDFSQISGAYDCTNFASHCLLAGGAVENYYGWYYNSLSSRSSSWSGVNPFHDFITTNTGTGPQADAEGLAYNCPGAYVNWSSGDIIQIQYSSYGYPGFGHSTVITGSYAPSYYSVTPRITSRTSDDSYTKDEILTVRYPLSSSILAYRLIKLTTIEN